MDSNGLKMIEKMTVNQLVVGSIPTAGANLPLKILLIPWESCLYRAKLAGSFRLPELIDGRERQVFWCLTMTIGSRFWLKDHVDDVRHIRALKTIGAPKQLSNPFCDR